MTREEAARMCEAVVKPTFGTISSNDNNDAYKEAFEMAIAALRGPEWVRTADSLPEDGERVLVTECGRVFVERFDSLLGFDTPTTHWMPLPQPPKEESNE